MASPNVEDTTSFTHTLKTLVKKSWAKVTNMVKEIGQDDPRRIIYSFKVGLALVLICILDHFCPSFYGFHDNRIWAVVTIVIVLERSVGAALGKGLNRMLATWLAGALGVASNKIATLCGDKGKVVMTSIFVFVIAERVTFMRFSPKLKTRYDYGMMIFILTFCLISISDMTGKKLLEIACERLLTIIIGSCVAMIVCISICPVWNGEDLHNKIAGFGDEYFGTLEARESNKSLMQGYKSVLNSKQVEDNFTNFAWWEPCHGRFGYRHPWQKYQKIGNLSRQCAYQIDALNGYLVNFTKTPEEIRSKIQEPCIQMSKESGKALKQLAISINKMIPPTFAETHIATSKIYATNLKSMIKTKLWEDTNLLDVVPVVTVASLLLDVVCSIEKLAESVQELSTLAKFKKQESNVIAEDQKEVLQPCCNSSGPQHAITIVLENIV